MLNRFQALGWLARDPELRYLPSGTPVCHIVVATDRPAAQDKERKADFIDCYVWREQAEVVNKYLSKGRLVYVEGRLQIDSYEDSQGIRRRAARVIATLVKFLPDGKGGNGKTVGEPPWPDEEDLPSPKKAEKSGGTGGIEDKLGDDFEEVTFEDDDIPF